MDQHLPSASNALLIIPKVPIAVKAIAGRAQVQVADLPCEVFKNPFLTKGIEQYSVSNGPLKSQCLFLEEWESRTSPAPILPSGFIFHMSRCGSTLLSQMLAELEGHRVVAEPQAVSQYLLLTGSGEIEFCPKEFRQLVAQFMPAAKQNQQKVFFKFSSWNIWFLAEILKAFPKVPWVFVGRDPLEVLVSNFKKASLPLRWYRKQAHLLNRYFQLPNKQINTGDEQYFFSWVITQYLEKVGHHLSSKGQLIRYDQLPAEGLDLLCTHFGLSLNKRERQQMLRRSQYYSKSTDPSKAFVADGAAKRAQANPALRQICRTTLDPLWQQLISLSNKKNKHVYPI